MSRGIRRMRGIRRGGVWEGWECGEDEPRERERGELRVSREPCNEGVELGPGYVFTEQREALQGERRMGQDADVEPGERKRAQPIHVVERDRECDRRERGCIVGGRECSAGETTDERGGRPARGERSYALRRTLVAHVAQVQVLIQRTQRRM